MKNPPAFNRINRTNIADAVISEIELMILSGKLVKGDRLPPEQELARQLAVGRSSIREALKALSSAGLVKRTPDGTFVDTNVASLTEPLKYRAVLEEMTLMELFEARRLLEVQFACLAALRHNREDLLAMQTSLAQMTASVDKDIDGFIEADVEYHFSLARAAHNRILLELFTAVRNLLTDAQKRVVMLRPDIRIPSLTHHKKILSAVEDADEDSARRCMNDHLEEVENAYKSTFNKTDLVLPRI